MVPQGIESVNGSSVNMGCTSPLVNMSGVMVCNNMSQSYLVDGCSPAIDTSTSDWASQLVTVRKTQTDEITTNNGMPFDHVLLTFGFDTAVTLTGIELDLFQCLELNTYAPFFTVYGNTESNFDLSFPASSLPFRNYPNFPDVIPHSCNSLSTVTIPISDTDTLDGSFHTWHILIYNFNSSIDWVRVGEVRFLGTDFSNPGIYNKLYDADWPILFFVQLKHEHASILCVHKTIIPTGSGSCTTEPTTLPIPIISESISLPTACNSLDHNRHN